MARLLFLVLSAGLLSACAQFPAWPLLPGHQPVTSPHNDVSHYSFDWRLSGNRQAAPLQVFDNGKQTWLQFTHGQPIPAIFQHTDTGDRPVRYQRQGPYVVLDGVWPVLLLRSGQLESRIERIVSAEQPVVLESAIVETIATQPAVLESAIAETVATKPEIADLTTVKLNNAAVLTQASFLSKRVDPELEAEPRLGPELKPDLKLVPESKPDSKFIRLSVTPVKTQAEQKHGASVHAGELDAAISLPVQQPSSLSISHYSVSPQDSNLRTALSRWATMAGWTFEPEHWAVDADIPIVGSASFTADFKPAVQDLLASTELADRPLQPCFYSNRVLRIVPYAQNCDRSVGVAS